MQQNGAVQRQAAHLLQSHTLRSQARTENNALSAALHLYEDTKYVLLPARPEGDAGYGLQSALKEVVDPRPRFMLALASDATDRDKLQAVLQVAAHQHRLHEQGQQHGAPSDVNYAEVEALMWSADYAQNQIEEFSNQLESQGWDVDDVIMWSGQKNVIQA